MNPQEQYTNWTAKSPTERLWRVAWVSLQVAAVNLLLTALAFGQAQGVSNQERRFLSGHAQQPSYVRDAFAHSERLHVQPARPFRDRGGTSFRPENQRFDAVRAANAVADFGQHAVPTRVRGLPATPPGGSHAGAPSSRVPEYRHESISAPRSIGQMGAPTGWVRTLPRMGYDSGRQRTELSGGFGAAPRGNHSGPATLRQLTRHPAMGAHRGLRGRAYRAAEVAAEMQHISGIAARRGMETVLSPAADSIPESVRPVAQQSLNRVIDQAVRDLVGSGVEVRFSAPINASWSDGSFHTRVAGEYEEIATGRWVSPESPWLNALGKVPGVVGDAAGIVQDFRSIVGGTFGGTKREILKVDEVQEYRNVNAGGSSQSFKGGQRVPVMPSDVTPRDHVGAGAAVGGDFGAGAGHRLPDVPKGPLIPDTPREPSLRGAPSGGTPF